MSGTTKTIPTDVPTGLLEKVKEASIDGTISCPVARGLAEELGLPAKRIGEAADALGVKIFGCELGCF